MRRRELIIALGGILAAPHFAHAQRAMPVIGFLGSQSPEDFGRFAASFARGLGEMGYVENRNVAIEYRWADGRLDMLPPLAEDLVKRRVAVIAATGGLVTARAVQAATKTIPTVFNLAADPVAAGLVASFNRPGGNLTGITWFGTELVGKRLGLLHELAPAATTVGLLVNPADPESVDQPEQVLEAARSLGLRLVVFEASMPDEIDAAFAEMARQRVGAVVVGPGAFFVGRRSQIVALAAQYRIPTAHSARNAVAEGGLMYYGNDLTDAYRRNGVYVGRILKGARPADLPIDRSSKFELLINVKTARALGLIVPPLLLAQANEVIE